MLKQSKKVDIAPFYLPVTSLGLSKTIDFLLSSTYIFTDAIMVAIPKPEKSKPTAFFNPFEHEVFKLINTPGAELIQIESDPGLAGASAADLHLQRS